MPKYGAYSFKLSRLAYLKQFLKGDIFYKPLYFLAADIYVGWGAKKYALRAKEAAIKHQKPFYFLEDGFIRSLYPSHKSIQPLSIILDKKGAYYDYKSVSELEELIKAHNVTSDEQDEAKAAIGYIKSQRLSKYVIGSDPVSDDVPEGFDENSVLILDQTLGDASLEYGGITPDDLPKIEKDILEQCRAKKIFLKTHPDVIAGKKKGCFNILYSHKDVTILPAISLGILLEKKPKTIVLTSLSGFEALYYGCEVTLYGLPWYAAYGLTDDKHREASELHKRRGARSLEKLFYAVYLKYPLYLDPISQEQTDFWHIAHYLSRAARHVRDMSGTLYVFGMSYRSIFHKERGTPWKKKDLMPFLQTEYNQVVFVHNADDAIKKGILQENHAKIVVWGYRYQEDIQKILDQKIIPTIRIEDGFIRSFGLGKDFIPPFSLVFDKGNLYYNASDKNASDVHHLLQEKPIPYLEKIGNDILEAIRKDNITKYNIDHYCSVSFKTDKTILCVIGQVPNDASLQYGGLPEHIKNNTDLLKYARQHFPDHFILFKPHPDIMAGHVEGEDLAQIEKYADKVDLDHSLTSLIDASDHILTMTSLAGLEAIIRHKKVTVLGKPFYKGYGFCEGEQQTNMSLAHFIYKIYCDYPLYIDGGKGAYGHAKSIISKILRQKKAIENPLRHIHLSHIVWKRLYQIKKWVFG